jgi:hypothetical protein
LLRKLAFRQLDEFAARKAYSKYAFSDVGLRREEILNKSLEQISKSLIERIVKVQNQLAQINVSSWEAEFNEAVATERKLLEAIWETNWIDDCDGKRLLEDLSKEVTLNLPLKRFKSRLMKEVAVNQSSSWRAVEGSLKKLLSNA